MQDLTLYSEAYNTHFAPEPDFGRETTRFFNLHYHLEAGAYACLLQLQLPEKLVRCEVTLRAVDAYAGVDVAELTFEARAEEPGELDDCVLRFEIARATVVEFSGAAAGLSRAPMLRHLRLLRGAAAKTATRQAFRDDRYPLRIDRLSAVLLGTTNLCNASCPHCPANKPMLAGQAAGVMNMALFEKLVDGLAQVRIEDRIWFGVFGEPFLDPTLEAKLEMLKRRLPDVRIGISTNAGAMDLTRLERTFELVSTLQIHVEAVAPARYDALMQPLRGIEVLPKIDEIVRRFPRQVEIISPLHRGNLTEADAIRERWGANGVQVKFTPLMNRSTARTGAHKMALWPAPGFWLANLVDILTVDWDGAVLGTCEDFLRRQPLGSLATQTLGEILEGSERKALHENLSHFRWADIPSLRDAVADSYAKLAVQCGAPNGAMTGKWTLSPSAFQIRSDARRMDDLIVVDPATPAAGDGPIVFGPYLTLPRGLYCVEIALSRGPDRPETVSFQVQAFGHKVYEEADLPPSEDAVRMIFFHDKPEQPVEFRAFLERSPERQSVRFGGALLFKVV